MIRRLLNLFHIDIRFRFLLFSLLTSGVMLWICDGATMNFRHHQ